MNIITENIPNKKAVAHTIVGRSAVYYDVCEITAEGQERIIWSEVVEFGRDKANRPGGSSFRNAAITQESRLMLYAKPDDVAA